MKKIISLALATITVAASVILPVSAARTITYDTGCSFDFPNIYYGSATETNVHKMNAVSETVWNELPWHDFQYKEGDFTDEDLSARMKTIAIANETDNELYFAFKIEVKQAVKNHVWKAFDGIKDIKNRVPNTVIANVDEYKAQDCVEFFAQESFNWYQGMGTHASHRQVRFNVGGVMSPYDPNLGTNQNLSTWSANRFTVVSTEEGYTYHLVIGSYMMNAEKFIDYFADALPFWCDIVVQNVNDDGTVNRLHAFTDVANGEADPSTSTADYGTVNYSLDYEYENTSSVRETLPADVPVGTTAPTTAPTEPAPAVTMGDVNNDGKVNIADAMMLFKYSAASISTLPNMDAADVTGDSKVNIGDSMKLFKFVSNQITEL